MGFSAEAVATFIAVVGVLSVFAQTAVLGIIKKLDYYWLHLILIPMYLLLLGLLMRTVGAKATILIGLVFEMLQLAWYGFGSQTWYGSPRNMISTLEQFFFPFLRLSPHYILFAITG